MLNVVPVIAPVVDKCVTSTVAQETTHIYKYIHMFMHTLIHKSTDIYAHEHKCDGHIHIHTHTHAPKSTHTHTCMHSQYTHTHNMYINIPPDRHQEYGPQYQPSWSTIVLHSYVSLPSHPWMSDMFSCAGQPDDAIETICYIITLNFSLNIHT